MIPAVIADSWVFWRAIIDGLTAVYILPTVVAIARQVDGLGLVICLNGPGRLARSAAPGHPDAMQGDLPRSSPAAAAWPVQTLIRRRR